jgi:hypothetical protein
MKGQDLSQVDELGYIVEVEPRHLVTERNEKIRLLSTDSLPSAQTHLHPCF